MNGAACGSGHLYSNHGFGVVAGVYRNEPVSDVTSSNRSEVADATPVLDTQANSHALSLIFRDRVGSTLASYSGRTGYRL